MRTTSLRAWLRKPGGDVAKVMIRLENGEEQFIVIPSDYRNRWKTVETSILAAGAKSVSLLDKQGNVLRAQDLVNAEEEAEQDSPEEAAEKRAAKNMHAMAEMLAAQATALNVAFSKGKEAASQSQDSLVDIVDTLAKHLSVAITNMHTVVANMATIQQAAADREANLTRALAAGGSDGEGEGLKVLAPLLAPIIQGMAASQANGKKRKED